MIGTLLASLALAFLLIAPAAKAEGPVLHVYNWSDYIAADTIPGFEQETGIKVTYDVYDGNEVLEAKLLAGNSGYDIVVPSATPFMARQIAAGAYRPLDKAKLHGLDKLDPQIMSLVATADPGNAYGVPYLWGTTGLGYNPALVRKALGGEAPPDSLALIFDPKYAEKLANCGISILDTPQEVFPAAFTYLGIDPTSRDPADLDQAVAMLEKVRPFIRKIHSSQYIGELANGDICIALGYSGDVIQARNRAAEAKNGVEIVFRVPREGALMAIDMLGIPKDAPDPENAHRFIDYLLRPKVIAAITNAVSYPNPNLAATEFVAPDIRDDPGIYPPGAIRKLFHIDAASTREYDRARTRAWNKVKQAG